MSYREAMVKLSHAAPDQGRFLKLFLTNLYRLYDYSLPPHMEACVLEITRHIEDNGRR